jgi:hypothetical protein
MSRGKAVPNVDYGEVVFCPKEMVVLSEPKFTGMSFLDRSVLSVYVKELLIFIYICRVVVSLPLEYYWLESATEYCIYCIYSFLFLFFL